MPILTPYSVNKFVDREAEVSLITGILRQLHESGGQLERNKAIMLRGERGFGKTWLSLHFHRTILKAANVESLYLALCPLPMEYTEDLREREWVIPENLQPEAGCIALIQWVCEQLNIEYPKDPDLAEMRRALVSGIEQSFKQSRLVLILDSVFEADWSLLEVIERNFLAPLAEIPSVLFIMTGRGMPYPWVSPVLRMGMQERQLGGIDPEKLEEFKTAHAPDSTMANKELADLAGGSPLVGYLLLQENNSTQALNRVADYLLEVVPPGLDRKRVREAFEALCVLDEFREGEMEVMLNTYYRIREKTMPPVSIRDLRDELLKTYLFRWEGSGFKVDASLRNVLRSYLKISQKELWHGLNCAAYKIYSGFAQKYSQFQAEYENLAEPYKANLEAIDSWRECEKLDLNPASA